MNIWNTSVDIDTMLWLLQQSNRVLILKRMSWRSFPSWDIDSLRDRVLVEALIVYEIVS